MSSVAQEFGISANEVIQGITAFLNFHIIGIFTYSLYTMIFVSTMHQIGARSVNGWPTQRIALTIIIYVIWTLATIRMGISWNALVSAYVTHGQSQNSVLAYVMDYGNKNWSKKRLILNIIADTTTALNAILAELINVWRCWELYNQNYLMAGLPLLCVLCGLISHILNMVVEYSDASPSASLSETNWRIVYYSVTAFTNVLTTFLIIFRILSVGGLKSARTYRGLLEILVESAFLYSATYILYVALFVRDFYLPYWSLTSYYVQGLLNAVTAAAPTMIIGRVMSGESRPNDSWTRSSLPPLGSAMRSLAESIRFSSFRPARTQNTVSTLDTTGQAADATASLTGEENSGASGEAVARHFGEAEVHVGSDQEIQVEREGVEENSGVGGETLAGHAGESEIQVEKRDGAEMV